MPHRSDSPAAIELDLVLEVLHRHRGYDFRHYARASLRRRLQALAQKMGCATLADLVPRLLHGDVALGQILETLSVPVTELFRDPEVFATLGRRVFAALADRDAVHVWIAGTASGEEAYSLAILLAEAGLLERTRITATDINDGALAQARSGTLPAKSVERAIHAYQAAGGSGDLAHHFEMEGAQARLRPPLLAALTFVHHNLVSDGAITGVDLILCRNVLIYFDRPLQDRVLDLFQASLGAGGFLCLGLKENVMFARAGRHFTPLDAQARIYRREALAIGPI
jgi:chemotaxis protein methyltransferase CheR